MNSPPIENESQQRALRCKELLSDAESQSEEKRSDILEVLFRTLEFVSVSFSEIEIYLPEDLRSLYVVCNILDISYRRLKKIQTTSKASDLSVSTASAIFVSEIIPGSISFLSCVCGLQSDFLKLSLRASDKMRLRTRGLESLSILVQSVRKSDIFTFWSHFLPTPSSPFRTSFLDCFESHKKFVLVVYGDFFKNSASFLKLADERRRHYSASYIPVSLSLAEAISDLHTKLLIDKESQADENEDASMTKTFLKTLQILVDNVPYHKLRPGLITAVKNRALQYLKKGSSSLIQVASLSVISSILNEHPKLPEVGSSFQDLYSVFLGFIHSSESLDNNVRYVAIQNLGSLVEVDTNMFLDKIPELLPLVKFNLMDPDKSIVLHVLRLVKQVGRKIQEFGSDQRVLRFWHEFLTSDHFRLIESRDCLIFKAALCDCLREMGQEVFNELPADRRYLAVSYLFTCSRSTSREDHSVVSSAVRGIGILITYQGLDSNPGFLFDSGDELLAILTDSRSHRNIIVSATWTLANLANCLAANEGDIYMDFPPYLAISLLEVSTSMAKDLGANMNVRANCVRSIGSFLQSMNSTHFDLKILSDLISGAIKVIVLNATKGKMMKVRWNSCYAAGCFLKNPFLNENESWRADLIKTLVPILQECSNFKVRIAAANAISSVSRRESFVISSSEDLYLNTCASLMNSFVTAASVIDDPEETKHKADLTDQVVLTLCHLSSLGDSSDLKRLNEIALKYNEYLSNAFSKASVRISPEKFSIILNAKKRIDELTSKTIRSYSENDRVFDNIVSINANLLLEFG